MNVGKMHKLNYVQNISKRKKTVVVKIVSRNGKNVVSFFLWASVQFDFKLKKYFKHFYANL